MFFDGFYSNRFVVIHLGDIMYLKDFTIVTNGTTEFEVKGVKAWKYYYKDWRKVKYIGDTLDIGQREGIFDLKIEIRNEVINNSRI